ncbi:MAG: hypothetical protein EPN85_00860 [Bacteroidetes bacterium]|nr:MAG: hypothetical protein EPN85_00860 [Bacteroidota bacterium]
MKKNILILLITISLGAIAQQTPGVPEKPAASGTSATPASPPTPPESPRKEKVDAMRIAFLTQKLDLSPEEAQKFWPVYNEFQKKRDEIQKKKREDKKSMKENIDSLPDKQIETIVDAEMVFRQKNLDLEKEYHGKFKSALPIKKVAKLYHAEDQFTHRLLEQLSERGKKGGMAPRNGHPDEEGDH